MAATAATAVIPDVAGIAYEHFTRLIYQLRIVVLFCVQVRLFVPCSLLMQFEKFEIFRWSVSLELWYCRWRASF